jgi:deoxyribodipyrimidine photolyase-related protein
MKIVRLILGDQLNSKHSWFQKKKDNIMYCLFEMRQETDYVQHHIQKVTGFFAAMRNFSEAMAQEGHTLTYVSILAPENTHSLTQNITQQINNFKADKFEYLLPDEYRLNAQLTAFCKTLTIENEVFDTEHFYTKREDLGVFFEGKKQFLMENFYRNMRKKHQVLVVNEQPEGGTWNYDKNNRKKWKENTLIPPFKSFDNNVENIYNEIQKAGIKTIGKINPKYFEYPITRKQALAQLDYFCEHLLVHFGDYQDAMHTNQLYLYHSRISFAMNIKLISPKEVIEKALATYRLHKEDIDISQVEGFVRQILGWREYMRGMYWSLMPNYKTLNTLNNTNKLPGFYWTGNTKMNCLKNAINNSLDNSYAHHIQRLMITGNYALLTQTAPDEVDAWYLGIYADAVEWVQLPNTRGMSQFADGGKIATKPYVSSGSYIHKMGNYCDSCFYNKKEKTTKDACPFNSLYWNFLDDKKEELSGNFRMGIMYSLLRKIPAEKLFEIKEKAAHIIANPNEY